MINSIPYYPYQQNVQILKGFFSKPLTLICAIVSGLTCILGMFSINTRAGSTNISFSSGTGGSISILLCIALILLYASIDCSELDPRLAESYFAIACDVTNPLCGPQGASFIFAPQKGADPDMVLKLDAALWHLADISAEELGKDFCDQPGAGAAGGLGFAFAAYLRGCLRPGVDIVLDAVLPEEQLQDADIVVTGEGRFDGQTAMGKAPVGIARRAKAHGCKVFVLAGSVEPEGAHTLQKDKPLVDGVFSILPGVLSLEDAMREEIAYENMRFTAEQVFRIVAGR